MLKLLFKKKFKEQQDIYDKKLTALSWKNDEFSSQLESLQKENNRLKRKSNTRVGSAIRQPYTRATLVAPMLPLSWTQSAPLLKAPVWRPVYNAT